SSKGMQSLKIKVSAAGPEILDRVRADIDKFPSQKIETASGGALIFTSVNRTIPTELTVTLPVTGAEFAQYLRATERINSKAPQIVELAKQIIGDDHDGRSVSRKLGEWTYNNLKWKKVETDTLETLVSHEAD